MTAFFIITLIVFFVAGPILVLFFIGVSLLEEKILDDLEKKKNKNNDK